MARRCTYVVYRHGRLIVIEIVERENYVHAKLMDGSSCFAVYIDGELYGREYVVINVAALLLTMVERDEVINDALEAISNVLRNGILVGEKCEEV